MKKSDLKTGYLVRVRSGEYSIILLGTEIGDVMSNGHTREEGMRSTWGPLENYNEDLEYNDGEGGQFSVIPDGDIVEVFGLPRSGNMNLAMMSTFDRESLWIRPLNIFPPANVKTHDCSC